MGGKIVAQFSKISAKNKSRSREVRVKTAAFTIVELLVVIVVIAILASVVIVSYRGITANAREVTLKNDLKGASDSLKLTWASNGSYPADASSLQKSPDTMYSYTYNTKEFCLSATSSKSPGTTFYIMSSGSVVSGSCPVIPRTIQTITKASCPTTRTLTVDARDDHTYWIQKLADGQCWMLTNLAYAGGGINIYNDIIPTGDGTNGTLNGPDNNGSETYTSAKYYIPTGANPTTNPDKPSTSTDGGVTGTQYGYLYNWCAAMGAQNNPSGVNTSACSNDIVPVPDTTTSICPSNWRLPTGGSGGEFVALNNAVNSGSTTSDSGLLASPWLAQRGGYWTRFGLGSGGSNGVYWSSTPSGSSNAYHLYFSSSSVYPLYNGKNKNYGLSVRCVAQ